MAEYSSLKVPELKKLLAEKKLPQTGNKADLIARLQEDDKKNSSAKTSTVAKQDKEDEITYSDDELESGPAAAPKAAPEPAPAAKPAAKKASPAETNAVAKPASQPADEAKQPTPQEPTDGQETGKEQEVGADNKSPKKDDESFALGLSTTEAETEAKRRAERAKRFGLEIDDEAKKRSDRAARFGIDENTLVSGLDAALPERALKRGRDRGGDDGGRARKRQNFDARGNRAARHGRVGRGGRRNDGPKQSSIQTDPVERAKAEKRAARFAQN
ncbi:hypothetical protein CDD82_5124 [Ophiocordyceps australis]|uniref:SAP domain-containing protein n=1 Tax=Ophiocordyceps australis TaxID=1399860 RepID=A0A2C5Y7L0_9HYPO|nr:hypothetical protein CDD82_5124 [Ophiocordyceps australis]